MKPAASTGRNTAWRRGGWAISVEITNNYPYSNPTNSACCAAAPLRVVYSYNTMHIRQVREKVASKVEARKQLLRKYVSDTFSREDVERALDSIADANNYIAFNVAPVER